MLFLSSPSEYVLYTQLLLHFVVPCQVNNSYLHFILYSILPTEAVDVLSDFLGTNRAMDTFVGNQRK